MAVNDVLMSVGLRRVYVAKRDSADGTIEVPAGTAAGTAYAGLRVQGALGLTPTPAAPTRVQVLGDDRLQHTFQLPPRETLTGELRVSKQDFTVIALLTSVKVFGSDELRKIAIGSDKEGFEDDVVVWGYRESAVGDDESVAYGSKRWQMVYFPNCRVSMRGNPWQDQTASEVTWDIIANLSRVDNVGTSLSEATHGCTRAPCFLTHNTLKPWLDAFVGDGAETDFTLSQAAYVDSDSIHVFVNGVEVTFTEADGVVTPTVMPADEAKVIVEYEWDES